MTSESGIMSCLESLIVNYCRSSFPFISDLKVKGLVTVMADNSATTYVDIDKTFSRDNHRKMDVGPRNALQQWKKSQNPEQVFWQNQQLQQQQPRMSGEMRSLRALVQSPSKHFRVPQMSARVQMLSPRMQSPKLSSVRMQQPYVRQSVVRLKKIPSHLDVSHSTALAAIAAAKSMLTQKRLPLAEHSESETVEATKNCLMPSGAEIENGGLAHSVGALHLYNQLLLPSVANKNKRRNGNQHDSLMSSGMDYGNSKEQWKKIPKLPIGQKTKKIIKEQSEEEEMKKFEEIQNCEPPRPEVGNGDSNEHLEKISKVPSRKEAKKVPQEQSGEGEEEDMNKVEGIKNCKPPRLDVGNADSKEHWEKIPRAPSRKEAKKTTEEGKEEEIEVFEGIKNCKPPRPDDGNADSEEPRRKAPQKPRGQKAKKALVEHSEEDTNKKEEKEEEEKYGKPNRRKMLKEMTTTQDIEALTDEHLTSKAVLRKRRKKVELMDEAKMPKLEKEVENSSFWNTFVSKGTGKGKKKSVAKQVKS